MVVMVREKELTSLSLWPWMRLHQLIHAHALVVGQATLMLNMTQDAGPLYGLPLYGLPFLWD